MRLTTDIASALGLPFDMNMIAKTHNTNITKSLLPRSTANITEGEHKTAACTMASRLDKHVVPDAVTFPAVSDGAQISEPWRQRGNTEVFPECRVIHELAYQRQ